MRLALSPEMSPYAGAAQGAAYDFVPGAAGDAVRVAGGDCRNIVGHPRGGI